MVENFVSIRWSPKPLANKKPKTHCIAHPSHKYINVVKYSFNDSIDCLTKTAGDVKSESIGVRAAAVPEWRKSDQQKYPGNCSSRQIARVLSVRICNAIVDSMLNIYQHKIASSYYRKPVGGAGHAGAGSDRIFLCDHAEELVLKA